MGFFKVNSAVKMPRTQVQKKPFSGFLFFWCLFLFLFFPFKFYDVAQLGIMLTKDLTKLGLCIGLY
jgi:hypothetical protein